MNIDDRLEALTQSVELLATMHRVHERAFQEHEEANQKQFERFQKQMDRMDDQFNRQADRFNRRFDRIEGQFSKQFGRVGEQFAQHEQLFGQIALRLREVSEGIESLARIAGVHQERLDDHGRKLKDLKGGPAN